MTLTGSNRLAMSLLLVVLAMPNQARAAEYFVAPDGSDAHDGRTAATAFAGIQKGVDALAPGDTLTIAPGEYFGSVRRQGIGSDDAVTTIRAAIPGTVVLRGDRQIGPFQREMSLQDAWVAEVEPTITPVTVNELDTLRILDRVPNAAELNFTPGAFYHDAAAGKLYLTSTDAQPASTHRYSASVTGSHGLYLADVRRVHIEGLAVTGFNAREEIPNSDLTLNSVFGIFIASGRQCVIRDCHAWLNGQGIGLNSQTPTSGDNVIERCIAWANATHIGVGDRGGITAIDPRRDVIRDCQAYLNGHYGINLRGNAVAAPPEASRSRLIGNLAWGNGVADLKIKGAGYHVTERCVGDRPSNALNPVQCLFRHVFDGAGSDSIQLDLEPALNLNSEFADPDNRDYRLQPRSRFVNTEPQGNHRGPFAYMANVYYVSGDGSDEADGRSMATAWRTLRCAVQQMEPGSTLYLEPGEYDGRVTVTAGSEEAPIHLRGRGRGQVVVRGPLQIEGGHLRLQRLNLVGGVRVSRATEASFEQCRFISADVGLYVSDVQALRVTHSLFTACRDAGVAIHGNSRAHLSGNLFDNAAGSGVAVGAAEIVSYCDYNSYTRRSEAWHVGTAATGMVRGQHDRHSFEATPTWAGSGVKATLQNRQDFAARGPFGRPVGPYREEPGEGELRLLRSPKVHRLSATTANVEWMTSQPATCELAWGDTPECLNAATLEVTHFGTFSLTGLKPGTNYFFRIKSLSTPIDQRELTATQAVTLHGEALAFTTLAADDTPATYYVAKDGDDHHSGRSRQQAWRTIQHAASRVNVGDTVLVAGGTYCERVRLRATGSAEAPITFRCIPGEKVVMDGDDKALNAAFLVSGKSHLRFDGLYFANFNREPLDNPVMTRLSGEFNLYHGRDIHITRCFSDGRNGYTARTITACQIDGLLIQNCVTMNKMSGAMIFERCSNLRLEHNVFARPMIFAFLFNHMARQDVRISNNIITDMLEKKAILNIVFAEVEEGTLLQLSNNCFVLRCFPPKERNFVAFVDHARHKVTRIATFADLEESGETRSVFVDPGVAGALDATQDSAHTSSFPVERLMDPRTASDFNSFFATHPEVRQRNIGLQPEAFAEFGFRSGDAPQP
jgi:hypothetical protein